MTIWLNPSPHMTVWANSLPKRIWYLNVPLALKIMIKKEKCTKNEILNFNQPIACIRCSMHGLRQLGAGGRRPWIFIHSTDKVEGGIMMLFFGLVFSHWPPWKFFCRRPWQYVLEFQSDHAQRQRKGDKWGLVPQGAGLEAHQHTLFRHLNIEFFSRNLAKTVMSKNAYFLEKKAVKLPQCPGAPPPNPRWPPAAGHSAPRSPRCYSTYWYRFVESTFLAWTYFITSKNNTEVTNSKCYAFASSALLRLFFSPPPLPQLCWAGYGPVYTFYSTSSYV